MRPEIGMISASSFKGLGTRFLGISSPPKNRDVGNTALDAVYVIREPLERLCMFTPVTTFAVPSRQLPADVLVAQQNGNHVGLGSKVRRQCRRRATQRMRRPPRYAGFARDY
jgi:hypothetical protein